METVAGRTGEVAERSAVLPPGASLEMDAAVLVGGVPVGVEFSVVADEVERERECYIELDGAHHALGERDEVRQLLDLVVDERDIRSVHGDVAAHAGDGQLFEKTAELHDERDLTRGEVFADADRRDQRDAGDHEQCDIFFCAAQL